MRQFGQWHGVQHFITSEFAAIEHNRFGSQCDYDMADQLHRLYLAIHYESCFTGLDHKPSGTSRRRRAIHGHQSNFGHAAILSVEPVKGVSQMKPCISKLFVHPVLIAVLGWLLAGPAKPQTFTTLYSFTASSTNSLGVWTNSDGTHPGGLILSSNTLYGRAWDGGSSGNGTIFRVNTDGTGLTVLHTFTASPGPNYTNSDGFGPSAVVLSGNTLYAAGSWGGTSGYGTIFALNTLGNNAFTTLHTFSGADGANPTGPLVISGDTLYGITFWGGSSGDGTVFKVNMDGTGFTNLYQFTSGGISSPVSTNSDGANPDAGLVLSGTTLYGTTCYGGTDGFGTVFAIKTDGTGFTNLHSFDQTRPTSGLILSGSYLYATTSPDSGWSGSVFKINTDGTDFTILYTTSVVAFVHFGLGGLIVTGNTLYGTAPNWGFSHPGLVFALKNDGTDFTPLHAFTLLSQGTFGTNRDGAEPNGLVLSGNTLYGTCSSGGAEGHGTVFSLSFTPQPTIIPSGKSVVLTWPNGYAGFDYTAYRLQSTTNLGPSSIWTTNPSATVVVNGQYTVTNPISATQQFFRLGQ